MCQSSESREICSFNKKWITKFIAGLWHHITTYRCLCFLLVIQQWIVLIKNGAPDPGGRAPALTHKLWRWSCKERNFAFTLYSAFKPKPQRHSHIHTHSTLSSSKSAHIVCWLSHFSNLVLFLSYSPLFRLWAQGTHVVERWGETSKRRYELVSNKSEIKHFYTL